MKQQARERNEGAITLDVPDTEIMSGTDTTSLPIIDRAAEKPAKKNDASLIMEGFNFQAKVTKDNIREIEIDLRQKFSDFGRIYNQDKECIYNFSINLDFESRELYFELGRTIIEIQKILSKQTRLNRNSADKLITLSFPESCAKFSNPECYQGLKELAQFVKFPKAGAAKAVLSLPEKISDRALKALGEVLKYYQENGQSLKIVLPANLDLSPRQKNEFKRLQGLYAHDFKGYRTLDFVVKDSKDLPPGFCERSRSLLLLNSKTSKASSEEVKEHNLIQMRRFKDKVYKSSYYLNGNNNPEIESLVVKTDFYLINKVPKESKVLSFCKNLLSGLTKTYEAISENKRVGIKAPVFRFRT